jgi:hypothetical protein
MEIGHLTVEGLEIGSADGCSLGGHPIRELEIIWVASHECWLSQPPILGCDFSTSDNATVTGWIALGHPDSSVQSNNPIDKEWIVDKHVYSENHVHPDSWSFLKHFVINWHETAENKVIHSLTSYFKAELLLKLLGNRPFPQRSDFWGDLFRG